MRKNRLLVLIFLSFFFIGQASAGTPHYINGTVYYDCYDGNWADYPYLTTETTTYWQFSKCNDNLILPKNIVDVIRTQPNKISFEIHTTKAAIENKSIFNVTGQRYIPIPDSFLKLRFLFDNVKPDVLIATTSSSWYADPSTFWYSQVDGQTRFNFLTSPYISLNATDSIHFIFNSYTINGSTSPTWQNSSFNNVTEDLGDHYVKTGIFRDNFDDKDFNWTVVNGSWSADNGYLNRTYVTNVTSWGRITNPIVTNNYYYSYNIRLFQWDAVSGVGLFFSRYQNILNTYLFNIYFVPTNTIRIRSLVNGVSTTISEGYPIVNTNQWYNVNGTINGTKLSMTFNGTTITAINSTYSSGIVGFASYGTGINIDNVSILFSDNLGTVQTAGNLTTRYDSGIGTETYQIDVNATTPENTNYTVTAYDNDTDAFLQEWTAQTGNQSLTLTGTKAQDTKINVTLNGNITTTPKISSITFWTQEVGAGAQPNITSWGNDYTNNNSLSFTALQNTNITFNATANQTLTTCSWINAIEINCSANTFAYKLFDEVGIQYVNLSGSNTNGSTFNSVNWTIVVEALPLPAPNITSWSNDNTSNNNLTLTILKNTNITFNITINQSATTTWTGTAAPTKINGTDSTESYAFKNFTTVGIFTVIASCSNINGSCLNSITWTITVIGLGDITFSGHVYNTLELPLYNAKIDYNGLSDYSDASGYFEFTNITDGTYSVLIRSIGYENVTDSIILTNDTSVDYILSERSWATTEDANNAGIVGFIGGIIGGAIAAGMIRKLLKK